MSDEVKAVAIDVLGRKARLSFTNETSLETLQEVVGGYVEAIDFPMLGLTMWCNEEAKLIGTYLPNYFATKLWQTYYGDLANLLYGNNDVILGNVVLTSNKTDDEGNIITLTNDQQTEIMEYQHV
jgi:hypothetical protein